MTEFEAAHGFLRRYAENSIVAVRRGDLLDDWAEFWRYCNAENIEPTEERLALVRDVAAAAREYYAEPEEEDLFDLWGDFDPYEDDEPLDPEDFEAVPLLFLFDTLECHGWRLSFLDRKVKG